MTEKKEKYYAESVGIDSDNELFLILPISIPTFSPNFNRSLTKNLLCVSTPEKINNSCSLKAAII